MAKRLLCLLLCIFALTMAGCSNDLSRSLMILTMGIDLNEKGVTVSVKAPDYGAAGKDDAAGGGEKSEEAYFTLSVTGKTWEDAMNLLNAAAPRRLRFGQVREIVVSLDTARSGQLARLLAQADVLQNVRTHARVIICQGSAADFLKNQKSVIGKRLSAYLDVTLSTLREKGYIPTATLSSLLRDLNSVWRDPLIACAAFPADQHAPADQRADGQPVDLLSGELGVTGASMGEYVGALALGSDGGHALLTGYEVQLYHLLTGQVSSMATGVDGQFFDVLPRGKSRMRLEKADGCDVLCLYLPVTVDYSAFREAPTADIAGQLQREAEALLGKLQACGCDALGYGALAAREYSSLFDFAAANWPARYRNAAVRVQVHVTLRQQGRT